MAGFSNITGDESIMFADNASFDGTERNGKLTTNGQLWIGSSSSPHVKKGTITSPDGSVTIGYSSPNITLQATPSVVMETLSDDVGTIVTPTANNIQLVGHVVEQGPSKFSTVTAGSHLLNINPMSCARWIVDPLGFNGTHTTIAAALTSATSGDTIFIMPGVYTENLTLKAGVNLTAFACDEGIFLGGSTIANVLIIGKLSANYSGSCWISGISVQTNSDFSVSITGTNSTNIFFKDSNFNGLNHTLFNYTSTQNSRFYFINCNGDLNTTGISYFSNASGGNADIRIIGGEWANDGSSVTPSTFATCALTLEYCRFYNSITTSSTASITAIFQSFIGGAIIAGGSGNHDISFSTISSVSSSAISVSSGKTAKCNDCIIDSNNTNAITGAGTISYSNLSFIGSSSTINTTTQTILPSSPSIQPQQPAFLAYQSANATNQTGDGSTTTVVCDTVVFDQASNYDNSTGIFTAPVTGIYLFTNAIRVSNLTASFNTCVTIISAAGKAYESNGFNIGAIRDSGNNVYLTGTAIVRMTAGQTSRSQIYVNGSTKTVTVNGNATPDTWFSGYLVC